MEILEYIDAYYTGDRSAADTAAFEERVVKDPEFAEAVAFYISVIQTAQDQNSAEKKKHFRALYLEGKPPANTGNTRRLWPYVAAAAAVIVAFFFGLSFYMQPHEPPQLADEFINGHLRKVGVQMSADLDSLEAGKALYNQGNFRDALDRFRAVIENDPQNFEAVKMAGITALQLKNFDQALGYFTKMEAHEELYVNHGKFYHALTLMKRNGAGDKEQAK
ncbi:MAG TPA: tetratricopeptide repeat protein, partial [Chitinophagaceae bacterium]|nr:tetratricopeptide repeat protein [Chitinophagaceae bacterium]